MNRREFVEKGLAVGLGLPFLNLFLGSCAEEGIDFPQIETDFSGKVLIVGAGAAGLAAGYLLERQGIDFQIVEAGSNYGGRLKRDLSLADFPIDLGAEWIHQSPSVLADIINNPRTNASLDFIVYNPQEVKTYSNGNLMDLNLSSNFYSEYKFKNTSWFGFFEQFIVPYIQERILFNAPITKIDYSGEMVKASTNDGSNYEADKILLTVPVNVMKANTIDFTPPLPSSKSNAFSKISMGDGIKVFMEFKEKFYPDILLFGSIIDAIVGDSNKLYYDARFRKESNKNILGLFAVQDSATPYTSLGSNEKIIEFVLEELDEIFDGKASSNYKNHLIQNWSNEPYMLGSYSDGFDGNQEDIINTIKEPINKKVYFAGEALTIENQSTVHGACETGYEAIERMLTD